jgi:penicillin-binding protein 1A
MKKKNRESRKQLSNEEDKPQKPQKKKGCLVKMMRWFVLIPLFFLVAAVCSASAAFVIFAECSKDLPNVEKLKFYSPSETTKIYSADGVLLATLFKENREWVSIDKVPIDMLNAIIASEDARFYSHAGISFHDIARAVYVDLKHQEVAQGASTITQQLAREIFLQPETSLRRKVREALLAVQIEKKFTKREILELYLNQIYFGGGAYGVQAAAKTYFGKDVSRLNLHECALLAGLLPAPSQYSPFVSPKAAKHRQILVLRRMNDVGFIEYEKMHNSIREELKYVKQQKVFAENEIKHPYFTTYALYELFQRYDDNLLYRGGLRVYTTLDPKIQQMAETAVKKGLDTARAQGLNTNQAALVAIEPETGWIRAMIGGTGWKTESQFNRAWQARRQPGSAFKVFVYTAAIDSGYSPSSMIADTPISFPDGGGVWAPKNADGSFMGNITMTVAFKLSRNVAAVRVLHQLSPEKIIQYCYKMGIKDKLDNNLSLALGSSVVTPLDMTSAVAVLANEGVRVEPTAIKKITDSEGNVIEDNTYPTREVILPASTAYQMTEMMKAVIESGTGTRAHIGRPAAGKTGTTDSFRDAWFVGYTPDLACSVWTGNDNYTQMNQAYGGNIPAAIWGDFMGMAHKGKPVRQFNKPRTDVLAVLICDVTGLRATTGCKKTHREFFKVGKEPRLYCTLHAESVKDDKKDKEETPMAKPEVFEEDLTAPPDLGTPGGEPATGGTGLTPQERPVIEEPHEPLTPPDFERTPSPQGQIDL